jgi:hypothetical protein
MSIKTYLSYIKTIIDYLNKKKIDKIYFRLYKAF